MAKTKKYQSDETAAANLANALTQLPDAWVMCRDMRHAWEVLVDFHVTASKGRTPHEVRRELICARCKTVRKEAYHPTRYHGLEKVSQHYAYPEDYQITGVPRGVKPSWIIQQEQYRRAMERISDKARS